MNTFTYNGVKLTLFGHASVLAQFAGVNVYVDPYVLGRSTPPADLILHTHNHFDHCASAPSIVKGSTTVIGRGCKHPGRAAEIGEKIAAGPLVVEVVDAYNIGKPFHPRGEGAGYILSFGPRDKPVRVYIAGDTDKIDEMATFRCDVAFLPIGGHYTMDAAQAAEAVALIKPKVVVPYHYNYLGETKADAAQFRQMVMEKSPGVDVRILTP